MEPPLLGSAKPNSCQQPPILDDVMQVVSRKRIKRRVHFEEDLAMYRLGTTRLQIVNQSFAHFAGQMQPQWCAGFRLLNFYYRILPIKLIELQSTNVSNSLTTSSCSQTDGIVASRGTRTFGSAALRSLCRIPRIGRNRRKDRISETIRATVVGCNQRSRRIIPTRGRSARQERNSERSGA